MNQESYSNMVQLLARKHKQYLKMTFSAHFNQKVNEIENLNNIFDHSILNKKAELLKPVQAVTEDARLEIKLLEESLEEKFLLFVVGMGNFGKSTLINALLQQPVAEVDFLPKTWKIDVFQEEGNPECCRMLYRDGTSKLVNIEEAKLIIEHEEKKAQEAEKVISKKKKENLIGVLNKEKKEEIEAVINTEYAYISDLIETRWIIEPNKLSRNFRLVDTPGLFQKNQSGEIRLRLNEYYKKADGVIWLLDAHVINAAKSHEMIKDLKRALIKVGGSTRNIVAVLNRIDLVERSGGKEAVEAVIKEANRLFGNYFKEIIPISAKLAWDGYVEGNSEKRIHSGIDKLLEVIDRRFYQRAQIIQLQSKHIGFKQLVHEYKSNESIASYVDRLRKDQTAYIKRKSEIDTIIVDTKNELMDELTNILSIFSEEVRLRINVHASKVFDMHSLFDQIEYTKKQIFCIEQFLPKIEEYQRFWFENIENKVLELQKVVQFHEYQNLEQDIVRAILKNTEKEKELIKMTETPKDISLAQIDIPSSDISLFEATLGSFFGTVIGKAWMLVSKPFKIQSFKQELKNIIDSYLSAVNETVSSNVNSLLNEKIGSVRDLMDRSFENLHGPYEESLQTINEIEYIKEQLNKQIQQPSFTTILLEEKKRIG